MRTIAALVLALAALAPVPAEAQTYVFETVEEWVEEWVEGAGADRFVSGAAEAAVEGKAYGPFRVLDDRRAALVDATDSASPRAFAAMLRAHPGLATLEMVECPGTDDDTANLALGRMIRAAGLATHVPTRGSVRSGAVELFLAGRTRTIDDGAEFAVHAWRDTSGRGPSDYAADAAPNRAYLDYYRDMGVPRPQAFYAMTNAVPNADARWMTAAEMRGWLAEGRECAAHRIP